MSRADVTEKILAAKIAKGVKWADVATKVGLSKEWVTAACLGQMTLNSEQAALVGAIFDLALGEKCDVVPSARVIPAARPAFVSM